MTGEPPRVTRFEDRDLVADRQVVRRLGAGYRTPTVDPVGAGGSGIGVPRSGVIAQP